MAFFAVAGLRVQRAALASGGQRKLALPDAGCDPTDAWCARAPVRRWTPELRLHFAVLSLALMDVRRYAGTAPPAAGLYAAAAAWLASDDFGWPYSFINCCEALELDPARVRALVAAAPPAGPVVRVTVRRRRAA